jgi:hypothetical protein
MYTSYLVPAALLVAGLVAFVLILASAVQDADERNGLADDDEDDDDFFSPVNHPAEDYGDKD